VETPKPEHRKDQPKPEAAVPKEGWLERVKKESFWAEDLPPKRVEAVLDKDTAVAFIANFYAAGIVNLYKEFGVTIPPKGSGELERIVVSRLGQMVNKVLRGEDYANYHDEWDISIERTDDEYNVTILGNGMADKDVKAAYERSLNEELINFELIKEWDLEALHERLRKKHFS